MKGRYVRMKMKLVETNLNLRIEKGHDRMEYVLSEEVARKLLEQDADIYTNVEFMECQDQGFVNAFEQAGYELYTVLDETQRGVMCAVKKGYHVEEIAGLRSPHMQHLRISNGKEYIDLITMRILVSSSNVPGYKNRRLQWEKILKYIDSLADTSHVVLTGDFNHGYIDTSYDDESRGRFYYNFQMIYEELNERNISLSLMFGNSYGNMKIDHVFKGESIAVKAVYKDAFGRESKIGIPDHKIIVAELEVRL